MTDEIRQAFGRAYGRWIFDRHLSNLDPELQRLLGAELRTAAEAISEKTTGRDNPRWNENAARLATEIASEQQWYDEARSLWQDTIGKPEADRAGELVKAGAAARHQRAEQLRAIATEAPQQIATELRKLAIVLDTTADSVADRLCELASMPTEATAPATVQNGPATAATADKFLPAKQILDLLPDWFQTWKVLRGFLESHPEIPKERRNDLRGKPWYVDLIALVSVRLQEQGPVPTDEQIAAYLQSIEEAKEEATKTRKRNLD